MVFNGGRSRSTRPADHVRRLRLRARAARRSITCPTASISPGLINTHDHITFTQNSPYTDTGERYEHRQQWRKGLDGHTEDPVAGRRERAIRSRWGELRFLMGGATSIVGSGGQAGLLRNLDKRDAAGGPQPQGRQLRHVPARRLERHAPHRRLQLRQRRRPRRRRSRASTRTSRTPPRASTRPRTTSSSARARRRTTRRRPGISNNLVLGKTAMIHAIGLSAADYGAMAPTGTGAHLVAALEHHALRRHRARHDGRARSASRSRSAPTGCRRAR